MYLKAIIVRVYSFSLEIIPFAITYYVLEKKPSEVCISCAWRYVLLKEKRLTLNDQVYTNYF